MSNGGGIALYNVAFRDRHTPYQPYFINPLLGISFTMLLDWRDYSDASYLVYQTFEDRNTIFFQKTLREDDNVVDVGASRGWFSFVAANICKTGTIVAVEPFRRNAELISRALLINAFENVFVEAVAAGDKDGEVELTGLAFNSGSQTMVGYLGDKNKLEKLATISEQVPLTTIEKICAKHSIEKVRIVKIDVQGAEMLVLKGMQKMLERQAVDYLLIEYTKDPGGDEVREYLEEFSYSCHKILKEGSLERTDDLQHKEDYVYTHLK